MLYEWLPWIFDISDMAQLLRNSTKMAVCNQRLTSEMVLKYKSWAKYLICKVKVISKHISPIFDECQTQSA